MSGPKEYKTVRLDLEAYRRLASRKREGESFSDVVRREVGERPIVELAGVLSGEAADDLRADVRRLREQVDAELEARRGDGPATEGDDRR